MILTQSEEKKTGMACCGLPSPSAMDIMVLTAYKVPIPIKEKRKNTAFPTPAELIETVLYLPSITTSAKPIKTKPN